MKIGKWWRVVVASVLLFSLGACSSGDDSGGSSGGTASTACVLGTGVIGSCTL